MAKQKKKTARREFRWSAENDLRLIGAANESHQTITDILERAALRELERMEKAPHRNQLA